MRMAAASRRVKRRKVGRVKAGASATRSGNASGGKIMAVPTSAGDLGCCSNPSDYRRGGPTKSAAVELRGLAPPGGRVGLAYEADGKPPGRRRPVNIRP